MSGLESGRFVICTFIQFQVYWGTRQDGVIAIVLLILIVYKTEEYLDNVRIQGSAQGHRRMDAGNDRMTHRDVCRRKVALLIACS